MQDKRYYIKKYMGDDKYSWAVFDSRDGHVVCSGCLRREAQFHRDQLESKVGPKRLAKLFPM